MPEEIIRLLNEKITSNDISNLLNSKFTNTDVMKLIEGKVNQELTTEDVNKLLNNKIPKSEILRLVEDKVITYALEKKTEEAIFMCIKKYIVVIISAIVTTLSVFGYNAYQIINLKDALGSANDTIEKLKGNLETAKKEIPQKDDLDKLRMEAMLAGKEVEISRAFIKDTRDQLNDAVISVTKQSSDINAKKELVESNYEQIKSYTTTAKDNAEKTGKDLNDVLGNITNAKKDIDTAKSDVEFKKQETIDNSKEVLKLKNNIQSAKKEAEDATKNVQNLVNELKEVKSIQKQLREAKISELVLIRANKSRSIFIQDPDPKILEQGKYRLQFDTKGLKGNLLELTIRVTQPNNTPLPPFSITIDVTDPTAKDIQGTPYKINFDFVYQTPLAPDFIVLRVLPK